MKLRKQKELKRMIKRPAKRVFFNVVPVNPPAAYYDVFYDASYDVFYKAKRVGVGEFIFSFPQD